MQIMIAVPCMDTMPVKFVESLMYMDKSNCTSVCFKPNSLIYDSRNLLSLTAMENNFDYVMWLDSDMVVPINTIPMLLSDAQEKNAPMVTGLYVKRDIPSGPVIFSEVQPPEVENDHMVKRIRNFDIYPRDSLFQVAGCGFGCVLTSVQLLREVFDKYGPAFAPFTWAGEDVSFCYRVKQLGHDIWCDSRVKCGHVGSFVYTENILNIRGGGEDEKH